MMYKNRYVPEDYKCKNCTLTGVKLWRDYGGADALLCASCAIHNQNKSGIMVSEDGSHLSKFGDRTDQIGWFVPAVPTDENLKSYWSYACVPEDACKWWRSLPLKNRK